jgi:hydroxymethylglutaryl-CoA synthase
VATLFSVLGRTPSEGKYNFTIEQIKEKSNMFSRLESRSQCSIEEFNAALDLREAKFGQAPMTPDGSVDNVPSGAYYLVNINDKHHRTYEKKA